MVFFGTKSVRIKSESENFLKCCNCEKQGGVSFVFFSKHVHIYWIPVFPCGRDTFAICENCGDERSVTRMPDQYKSKYNTLKSDAKTPLWQFSGLGVIGVLIGLAFYISAQNNKRDKEYYASPRVGDVYHQKINYNEYSTFKVAEITTDTLYIIPNEYIVNKMSGISKIDKAKNYGELMYAVSRDKLDSMFKNEEIFEIERD